MEKAVPDRPPLRLHVRVLSVTHVLDFRGSALVAGVRPKFVVALLLEGKDGVLEDSLSGIRLRTHQSVVFALDSVAKLFGDKEVVGRIYEIDVHTYDVGGVPRFYLALA